MGLLAIQPPASAGDLTSSGPNGPGWWLGRSDAPCGHWPLEMDSRVPRR